LRVLLVPTSNRFDDAPDSSTASGNTSTKDRTIDRIIDCGTP
jgi:hypothetical protein